MKTEKKRNQTTQQADAAATTASATQQGNAAVSDAIRVEQSVTINRAPEDLYNFWRDFQNLPRFMRHLVSVQTSSDTHSHWVANAPAGMTVKWDAEIINDQPNELIAWRSLAGADVDNAGSVRFEKATGGRGTFVRVTLQYDPPGGTLGSIIAKLFGEEPKGQIQEDLGRFKQLMETGEIATTVGQSSARKQATEQH